MPPAAVPLTTVLNFSRFERAVDDEDADPEGAEPIVDAAAAAASFPATMISAPSKRCGKEPEVSEDASTRSSA